MGEGGKPLKTYVRRILTERVDTLKGKNFFAGKQGADEESKKGTRRGPVVGGESSRGHHVRKGNVKDHYVR